MQIIQGFFLCECFIYYWSTFVMCWNLVILCRSTVHRYSFRLFSSLKCTICPRPKTAIENHEKRRLKMVIENNEKRPSRTTKNVHQEPPKMVIENHQKRTYRSIFVATCFKNVFIATFSKSMMCLNKQQTFLETLQKLSSTLKSVFFTKQIYKINLKTNN